MQLSVENIIVIATAFLCSVAYSEELTFNQALRKANAGDSDAQWQLARMYKNGKNGATHSYEEAVKWYKKAADAGHPKALCGLAGLYEKGHGVDKSPTEAMNLYLQAASGGYARAYTYVGYMYEDGIGVAKAPEKAFSYYLKAASRGDLEGQNNLGRCYTFGIGCTASGTKAEEWLLKAAKQKSSPAYEMLGLLYDSGRLFPKSEAKALTYYRAGAELGSEECKKRVAELTALGRDEFNRWSEIVANGKHRNNPNADSLLRVAAEKGYEPAQYIIAEQNFFEAREADDYQKYAESIKWFRKSAAQGNTQSMKQLSCLYALGNGCKQSYPEAFYWAEKGSNAGDAICKMLLAYSYENGWGCKVDNEKAFSLIQQAAKEHYADAWYQLAIRYISGKGTPVSVDLGLHWLKKAADDGHKEAEEMLMTFNGEKYVIPTSMSLGCRLRHSDPATRQALGITSVERCNHPENSFIVFFTPKDAREIENVVQREYAIVKGGIVISLAHEYTLNYSITRNEAIKRSINGFCLPIELGQLITARGIPPSEVERSKNLKKAKSLLPRTATLKEQLMKAVELCDRDGGDKNIYLTMRNDSKTIDTTVSMDIGTSSVTVREIQSLVSRSKNSNP